MKKIGLVILFLSAFVSSAFAQVGLNPRFDEQSNAAIGEANSSCNVVSEPFFKFICLFRDDEDFRNERIKINVEYEVEDYETMGADDVPEENSFEFFEEAYNIDIENDAPTYLVYSASWFDVTGNRVCYARGEACDDGTIDAEVIYIFEFIGGKWFLTSYLELPSEDDESDNESDDEEVGEESDEDDEETPSGKLPKDNFVEKVNGVSFEMVYVKGGTFQMGSNDSGTGDDEKPVHSVTLSDYYIGETEVTQELWEEVMGTTIEQQCKKAEENDWGLGGVGSNNPMYYISWSDCQEFIKKLNQMTGKDFRLPTEAEWEYAARGGNKSRGYKYSGSNNVDDVAWSGDNTSWETHPVGTKSPNELGIYDMSGNVLECCADWFGDYSSSSQTNPTGPASGSDRVYRGGGLTSPAQFCRVTIRHGISPGDRYFYSGFRLAVCP